MADRPIEEIREALIRIHHVAIGKSTAAYMSVPADPKRDADLILSAAIDELAALRVTRDVADRERVHHVRLCDELGSLKRRITELRRGHASLAGGNCLTEIEEYKEACAAELKADDARRRRFEKKQRKVVRRG